MDEGRELDMARKTQSKKGGRPMYAIDEIRTFNVEGMALEDLVTLSASARAIQGEFATLNVEEPEWLNPKVREIRREVATRQADRIEKLIREKKSRLEVLKPAEQKRQELADEIAKLESQLAGQA